MRYLLISDIHSNLEGLESVLTSSRGRYDKVLCLGDLVGYGPNPNEVIEGVRALEAVMIRGNHDKACCGITNAEDFNLFARLATIWTREHLSPENYAFLRTLPQGPLPLEGFQIFHGSWLDEDEYIFGPGEALPNLRQLPASVGLFGHTHVQGGFMLTPQGRFLPLRRSSGSDEKSWTLELEDGGRYLINPGSVGQPRDGDWRVGFALFDTDKRWVEYFRLPYDLKKTQEKMRAAELPDPLIARLAVGR